MDLSFVTAVNNDSILENNLLRSPIFEKLNINLNKYYSKKSASIAYNQGIQETDSEYVAFVHQDVYLPGSWLNNFTDAVKSVSIIDPDWAVLGAIGKLEGGGVVGNVWSSGLGNVVGKSTKKPVPVASIDELLIVIRRQSGISFDDNLPGFHLYGTDIVQEAIARGKSAYVCNLPVIHNSKPVDSLTGDYANAYRYMQRKWRSSLPIKTLIVPITNNKIALFKAHAKMLLTKKSRRLNAYPQASDPSLIAKKLGYE